MEEPTFLLAVDRVVGGVEVEHDLLRRSLVAIEEDVHEQCFQARRIVIDLVILPGLAPRPVLQPVERALAGHRRTVRTLGLELAGQHMEQRVVTKLIVVVQVFIAEREGEHALADQGLDRVLEQSWVAPVGETAGHPTDQPEAAIQPPQQQPSGIRCDDSAIEPGHNLVPFNRFKFEQCWATLCLHRGLSGIAVSDWRIAIFRDSPPRCFKGFEKSGLGPDAPGLSASTIARLKVLWWEQYLSWQKRDLSAKRYVYFWADGVYFSPRLDHERQCILVIIAADAKGHKDIVGLMDGYRESEQSWKELLLDLKRRGLERGPDLAGGDGALGFWKALRPGLRAGARTALLGSQDRQRAEQDAEKPASQGQRASARHLDGGDQE